MYIHIFLYFSGDAHTESTHRILCNWLGAESVKTMIWCNHENTE